MSPGPFRQPGPPSSSASRSTSPGPSTLSVYASGMDTVSVDPSTSPDQVLSPRVVPTFRELPRRSEGSIPLPSNRQGKGRVRDKGGRRYHAVVANGDGEEEEEVGRGRGRYAGLGTVKGDDGGMGKTGLDGYQRALWRWVNVDDLDGFLQEVRQSGCLPSSVCHTSGLRLTGLRCTRTTRERGYTASPLQESSISCT